MTCLYRFIIIVNLTFLSLFAEGQDTIHYRVSDKVISVGDKALFFSDNTQQLKFAEISSDAYAPQFEPDGRIIPNFGMSNSAVWCKFIIYNETGQELFLEYQQTLAEEVEFVYQDEHGSTHEKVTGNLFPYATRDVADNFFLFRIPNSSLPTTYYLRIRNVSNTSFPLFIGNAESMFSKQRHQELIYGIFFGLIFALILHSMFIYYAIRDKTYLYYFMYLFLSAIAFDDSAIGLGAEYIWGSTGIGQHLTMINHLLICIVMIFTLLFISSFLYIKTNWPKIMKVNKTVYAIGIVFIVLELLTTNQLIRFLIEMYLIVVSLYCLFIIVYLFIKGVRTAKFLLVGWTFYVLSVILFMLYIFGILPFSEFTTGAPMYGLSIECVFFSFALADRLHILRKEKLKSQKEKNHLIKEQNNLLEKAVYERTLEISTQNEEIAAQNEELIAMQDQMVALNTSLEEEVNKQTKDLSNLNEELIEQNQQLQQYSFIAAHNLRSPVATVLGLINVLNLNDPGHQENQFIIEQIKESGQNLDRVIRDLTTILDIKKGLFEKSKPVNLMDKIEKVNQALKQEIEIHNVAFKINISQDQHVMGFGAYIESIFLNLISNAIKYRSPNRQPLIKIDSVGINEYVKITIADNGLGIDLENQRDKIFGMYQRFHLDIEGKGLGLHLVKTQVESMGGQIDVHSKIDVGTTFDILLPNVKEN